LFYFVNQQQPPAFADEPQGLCELRRNSVVTRLTPVCFVVFKSKMLISLLLVMFTWRSETTKAVFGEQKLITYSPNTQLSPYLNRDIRFGSTADRDAWVVKLQAAARGLLLYDAQSLNVAADVLTTATHAPQLDARTGVDFRVLPAGMAPISSTPAPTSAPTTATPLAPKSSSHLTYPDSDDEEIAQRHQFGGRYTEWLGPDVYDHGINIPSGVVTPLSNSIAPSLLDSSASNLQPSQEIELDSGPPSPSDLPIEQPQPDAYDAPPPAMPNAPSNEPMMPPPLYTDVAPPTMVATQPQPQPQQQQQFMPQTSGPYQAPAYHQAPSYNSTTVQFPSVPTYQPGAAPRQQQWQAYPGTFGR
jgi:hypothetical protein